MRIALFPGSFDPFTLGHEEIVSRSLGLFDQIVIGVGVNVMKKTLFSPEERVDMIRKVFRGNNQVSAQVYEGLTTSFAKKINANFLLRGIRSTADIEIEYPIATINRENLGGIETFFLLSSGKTAHISSTIVRELLRYGAPITGLVPEIILNEISGKSGG